jgi:signal transduction histidine kinase/CheY-like chemotaxis protein
MNLGIKNRLRLISLFPITILILSSIYFVYDSYKSYEASNNLKNRLEWNKSLNELIEDVSKERGMTVMYMGNSSDSTKKSLRAQRDIVDTKFEAFKSLKNSKPLLEEVNGIEELIIGTRANVDKNNAKFDEVFDKTYGSAQNFFIKELSTVDTLRFNNEISDMTSAYLTLTRANQSSAMERDYLTYILAKKEPIDETQNEKWLSMISSADSINLDGMANKNLQTTLKATLFNEDNIDLFQEINTERSNIMKAADSGKFKIQSGVWFAMISEKNSAINKTQTILLNEMDKKASIVSTQSIELLAGSVGIWLLSLIISILSFFLSNDMASNIKRLELVLRKVAKDMNDDDDDDDSSVNINLDTKEGTFQACSFLEKMIQKTLQDKQYVMEASEAKSMFLSNMSHEIRTPLNGVVGFAELLKDTDMNEEQQEFLDIILKSSANLIEIINNILDISKIESNKLEIEEILFSPLEEFESAVEVYAVRASEKHIDLVCFVDPSLEKPLKGDPNKLKEVIINLLSNAVKFTNIGGAISVAVKRLESDKPGFAKVYFEVKDNGIGVSEEQKSRIFEAFSQADLISTRKYGGTGLGLTISSSFIEAMGGKIDINSEVGVGTTFYFTLDFEEIENLNPSIKGNYNNINAVILESNTKEKRQAGYLKSYLDFYGVRYTIAKSIDEIRTLQAGEKPYHLLIIDNDLTNENDLVEYSNADQQLVLITKSYYMKKIEGMGIDIFKVLYKPLTGSKLKHMFDSYDPKSLKSETKQKSTTKTTVVRKKFDEKNNKFDAQILVAEDNIINQKLIKRILEDLGFTITIANNGLETFELRKSSTFDLIFMDINMPQMDGLESTEEILKWEKENNFAHIPIIALTANALKGDRERFLSAGMDEYTRKPLVRSEIVNLLNNLLGHKIVDIS